MDDREHDFFVWQDTLARLTNMCEPADIATVLAVTQPKRPRMIRRRGKSVAGQAAAKVWNGCVKIRIGELNARTATLSWHDSTSCHYDDQRWRRGKARCAGICSLSGKTVTRGADVFRPSRRGVGGVVNSDAMILASALADHADANGYETFDR